MHHSFAISKFPMSTIMDSLHHPHLRPGVSHQHHPRGLGSRKLATGGGTALVPSLRRNRRLLSTTILFALATEQLKTLKKTTPVEPRLVWQQKSIHEDYELGDVLGEGQQGIVKEATSKKTGQKHAVKIMSKIQAKFSSPLVKRMKTEASILSEVQNCPFAVRLMGAYEDRENIYIVMDCLLGGSLGDNLQRMGPLTEQQTAQLMFQVFSFLSYLHTTGVCYGDLKPANFMLTSPMDALPGVQPILKAVDFGCCQKVVPGLRFRSKTGTPLYMAPEVHLGNYGVESDVWSAAVMMFQMISGDIPFVQMDRRGVVMDIGAHVGYSFDTKEWQNVSDEAKDLLDKVFIKDKSKRLSAKEVLQHPWFNKYRSNVSSNIISLRKEKNEERHAESLA